jgi:DNA polymerase I
MTRGTEETKGTPRKTLFLIDGNSLLYRSFYAIQKLATSQGFPTNAIFGFISTLRKIIDVQKPDYLGIVFDTKGPTVRHEAYKEYKAQRKPMPEDLVVQVPVLKKLIAALGIPVYESPGYEADDVLASLARMAAARELHSVIVTTDKDLLQVVDSSTSIFNPSKDITIEKAGVKEFFGVEAAQVADVLSLWGDPSDNIPGVPGIGEKTAKSLILEFGSLDNVLAHLDKIKNPRVRENIEKNGEVLDLSRRLVRIEDGLALDFDLEAFALSEPDAGETTAIFRDLEFTSLIKDFVKTPADRPRDYRAIFDAGELETLAADLGKAGAFALDTETDSPFPTRARLVGISFAMRPGEAFYVPLRHDYLGAPAQIPVERALDILRPVLENPGIRKTGQNIKYDLIVLRREGVELQGVERDTMVLSYLLEPNWGKHGLERVALHYLGTTKRPYESVAGKGKNQVTMDKVGVAEVTPYACQDADLALELGDLLWQKAKAARVLGLYSDIELPLIDLLARMEIWGVKVDRKALKTLSDGFGVELRRLEKAIYEAAGTEFNINSPKQLGEVLFTKLNLPMNRKTRVTKGFSTSVDVLQELAPLHPLARYALEYRQAAKLKSTYADALPELIHPETGRIHTSYNQTVASTGRLSSSDPNLQNIPARGDLGRRFRQAFIPEDGCLLLAADYSQIELRLLAHLSGDPTLVRTFLEDRDIHGETAGRVFGEDQVAGPGKDEARRRAKIINFSIIYGTSAFSLAKELGTSNGEAQDFIDRYYAKYPLVKEYLDRIVGEARDKGFSETIFGRIRQVPELRSSDRNIEAAGRRIALNTPIQGSAADVIKKAMLNAWKEISRRKLRAKMILQVHDELVFEVPEEEKDVLESLVRREMEDVCSLSVPLKAHLGWGRNWAEAK